MPRQKESLEANKRQIQEIIYVLKKQGKKIDYQTVSQVLPELLAKQELQMDTSAYEPMDLEKEHGVGRYLIYDNEDKDNPFSIWAFAFGPRQKTVIHNHKYLSTVTVLVGPIAEKFYQPVVDSPDGKKQARLVSRSNRYRFHTNRDDLTTDLAHQLKCRKQSGSYFRVTLHIYNMSAYDVDQVQNRNLKDTFLKADLPKKEAPAYTEEMNPSHTLVM